MESAPTKAPPGWVWLLVSGDQDHVEDGLIRGIVDGLFSDRAMIPKILIRGWICGADHIRDEMARLHWHQGVFNTSLFEGWAEEPDAKGRWSAYDLSLHEIDRP